MRLTALLAFVPCLAAQTAVPTWVLQDTGVKASLRGISAVTQRVVWASGTGGTWLRTADGGSHWQSGTVPGAERLDFRGIRAFDDHTAILLSAGPADQSRVYRTTDAGATWDLLFTNPDHEGFFDAIAFASPRRGMILGDPVAGSFTIFTTEDGGLNWTRQKTPPAGVGEGAFAASNSCLTYEKSEASFGTGGPTGGRFFHSTDSGKTWTVTQTPVRHDTQGAGIFSIAFGGTFGGAFSDRAHGIAVGGDYGKDTDPAATGARTDDGGKTWSPIALHGYRSSVVHLKSAHLKGKLWLATGTSGSEISRDGGKTWRIFDTGKFHAISVAPDGTTWASGPDGRIARLSL